MLGVQSGVVIADASEARELAESDTPLVRWDGIEIKTIDPLTLGTLWAILATTSEAEAIDGLVDRIALLCEVSEEGPWVYEAPRELRDVLSVLSRADDNEARRAAEAWAATDELQGWDYADVEAVVRDLADLADTARLQGKDLLLWMSL